MTQDTERTTDYVLEWRSFATVYHKLAPPLTPTANDVALVRRALPRPDAQVVLLGVTPGLAGLGGGLIAIDKSPRMVAQVWPGDTAQRRAVRGDWTRLPLSNSSVDAVIGDGSLNSAPEQLEQVLAEARRALAPGGRAIMRTFCSPEVAEPLSCIADDVARGWSGNVHALKWRIAMSLAAEVPRATVPARTILAAFDDLFPDRRELMALTGWSLGEIGTFDAYSNAAHSLGFPTLKRLLHLGAKHFNGVWVEHGGGYPLSERCPTIIWRVDE